MRCDACGVDERHGHLLACQRRRFGGLLDEEVRWLYIGLLLERDVTSGPVSHRRVALERELKAELATRAAVRSAA